MKKAFTLIELLIVVAIIAILAAIAVPNFLEAQTRAKVSRVASDQRSYATGLETYYLDNNSYPIHWPRHTPAVGAWSGTGAQPSKNINDAIKTAAGQAVAPYDKIASFAAAPNNNQPIGLTSPVSYLNTYSSDAFAEFKQATFSYAASGAQFLIWSPGPDSKDALDIDAASGGSTEHNAAEFIVAGGQSLPSPYLIAGPAGVTQGKPAAAPGGGNAFTYDPTNGTGSYGDVYRTK